MKPAKVTLTKNKTSATFELTMRENRFIHIKYNITGNNAAEFDNPNSTIVFIDKTNETVYKPICYQCDGILENGCFTVRHKNFIFTSYLQWSGNKTTRGVTQLLAYENNTLPLPLTGIKIL